MKKNLGNDVFLLTAAITLSVFVWFAIIYTKNPAIDITVKNIPVNFSYEDKLNDKGLCVVHQAKPLTASVALRGRRNDLFHVIGKIDADINLSEINSAGTIGMNVDFSLPAGASNIEKGRSSVNITIDKTAEKDVPVVINQTGTNKNYLVKSSFEPDVIHISGAESEVNLIEQAAVSIDISSLSEDSSETSVYIFTNDSGDEIEPLVNISASDRSVSVHNELYRKKVVNIDADIPSSVSDKYDVWINSISPSECVAGIRESQYESISSVSVILPENITAGQNQKFEIPISGSDDICAEKNDDITVNADIEEKKIMQKTVPIEFIGVSREKINPSAYSVTINLLTTETRLAESEITASINLTGLSPGEYRSIPIIINAPEQISVNGTYETDVVIND